MVVDDGKERDSANDMGNIRCPVGANRTGDFGVGPAQGEEAQTGGPRKMLEGVIFRMRSSCAWNHLPKELGDDSTIHRTFQRWVERGVLDGPPSWFESL